jgi:hypothetical protein
MSEGRGRFIRQNQYQQTEICGGFIGLDYRSFFGAVGKHASEDGATPFAMPYSMSTSAFCETVRVELTMSLPVAMAPRVFVRRQTAGSPFRHQHPGWAGKLGRCRPRAGSKQAEMGGYT